MTDENKRRYTRTRLRAEVKLNHPEVGELNTHTRDISEGGAFVVTENPLTLHAGDIIEVQVQGLPGEPAPVVPMRVVRIHRDGVALEFLQNSDEP